MLLKLVQYQVELRLDNVPVLCHVGLDAVDVFQETNMTQLVNLVEANHLVRKKFFKSGKLRCAGGQERNACARKSDLRG